MPRKKPSATTAEPVNKTPSRRKRSTPAPVASEQQNAAEHAGAPLNSSETVLDAANSVATSVETTAAKQPSIDSCTPKRKRSTQRTGTVASVPESKPVRKRRKRSEAKVDAAIDAQIAAAEAREAGQPQEVRKDADGFEYTAPAITPAISTEPAADPRCVITFDPTPVHRKTGTASVTSWYSTDKAYRVSCAVALYGEDKPRDYYAVDCAANGKAAKERVITSPKGQTYFRQMGDAFGALIAYHAAKIGSDGAAIDDQPSLEAAVEIACPKPRPKPAAATAPQAVETATATTAPAKKERKPSASTPIVATMIPPKVTAETDALGARLSSNVAKINAVLLSADKALTVEDVAKKAGNDKVGSVRSHLRTLTLRGLTVRLEDNTFILKSKI